MGYCNRCGTWAALDAAAMCRACRDGWRPAGSRPGDLGCHGQPQTLGCPYPGSNRGRLLSTPATHAPAERRGPGTACLSECFHYTMRAANPS